MASPVIQFKRGLLANLPGLQAGEPGFTTDSYDFYIGLTSETSTNKFFGSHRYWTKETTSTGSGVNLVEGTGTGSSYITLKAPDSLAGVTTYTFPATATADYYLKTAADGTLSWAAVSQSTFAGIVTFTDATDNTLGDANTGAIQIDGGLGVNKNVTVGAGLSVVGTSRFAGDVTFASAAYFGDGDKLYFGDGNDLEIFHNGENSFIKDTGTGTLNILASGFSVLNAGGNETLANFTPDGSVELYYDNSKKFETTGVGATITGNLGVSGNLAVAGTSEFIGVATFRGGTINLGDSTGDDINVGGEFISGLFPNTTATYDLGDGTRQWRHGNFSGIVTASSGAVIDGVQIGINGANVIDTVSGNLTLNSAGGTTNIDDFVNIQNNLNVTGNVTIGGTTVTLTGQDVFITNKDIVLGYTTTTSPTDTTANHAGVAIASTEGTPLVNFDISGINTLPNTYKQMMWFKSGTLGFSTDTFAFNYGVAIGTTSMSSGARLAVGTGVSISDTAITATNFYGNATTATSATTASSADQVKTVTASNNTANYYLTFVDSHNGSATAETVYTDDGVYYNPGTNTFTTQYGYFTGNLTVDGSINAGTITGTASTATRATTVDTTSTGTNTNYHLVFTDNATSTSGATMRVDAGIYYNPSSNNLFATQFIGNISAGTIKAADATTSMTLANSTGDVTFNNSITVPGTITGTATTATRATLIDTTATSTNGDYYVTFVDTLAGQTGETLRVGAGLSINPSTGNVGVSSILSVGSVNAVNAFIKAGGGSNALYLYSNGDVSFQAKAVVNEIRSASDSNTLITLSGLDATFARNVKVVGVTTTQTLSLSGTPGIAITAISSSTTLAENSNAYLPTQAAVKAYVDAVDLTTSLAGDTGTGSVSTSQTLTIAGTAGEIETSASGQTITVGLPDTVVVGTALSAPTLKTATLQHRNGTQAATIDTSGNITASQNLTVTGNLYVNGSTTQVNTTSVTVEDRTLELGLVDGSAPGSTTTWDLGVLFNYYDGSAKKSALVWEQGDARFKLGSVISAGADGTGTSDPQITFTTYAPLEIGALWVNDCAGQSQVINCSGGVRKLENITIDCGTF